LLKVKKHELLQERRKEEREKRREKGML